ncbi:MAG: hypothetical protein M3680_05875 [Myxococcota bacterium]|nr:hypothetical protein [Myxococcota bacterium]
MAFEQERKAALRILDGITEGTMSSADSFALVDDADPALIYLLFTWIRAHYKPDDPAGDAVLGRLVEVSSKSSIAKKMKEGAEDPVVEWFEDAYSYRKVDKDEFVELIIEKLEG